jgi:hypothetical protein
MKAPLCYYYTPLLYLLRGGGGDEALLRGGGRDDAGGRDEPQPPQSPQHDHSSILSSIVRQSTKALAATARGSTQIAADLVRPKEVDWKELVGWWRLDMSREDTSEVPPLTVQLTRQGTARFTDEHGQERDYPVDFRPASWPRSARLRFGSKKDGILYECTVQRKLANLDILKLRGRVFVHRRFQGKVPVGTFIGRRRVVIVDGEEDSDDEYDDEYDEEEDDDGEDEDTHAEAARIRIPSDERQHDEYDDLSSNTDSDTD